MVEVERKEQERAPQRGRAWRKGAWADGWNYKAHAQGCRLKLGDFSRKASSVSEGVERGWL